MIDGLEPLFQQIADSMMLAIPEEWATARFEAIFFPDGSTYEAEYTRGTDKRARSFQPASGGSHAFRQLREVFRASGKPLWGRACLELNSDGSFNMTWGYDNCDENGDSHFNEEQELRRHQERHKRLSS